MLFQQYMTGRGVQGYGFRAQTTGVSTAPYLQLRASDTGATERLLLEIMTTKLNEIAVIGSRFDREQSNGYTDVLFADSKGGAEWQAVLENPARLLYLPHISKDDFLKHSRKGNNVSLGTGENMELPSMTHRWDNRFRIDDDTLADLAADVWYAAFRRIKAPDSPGTWSVIHIRLTDQDELESTLDIGREFFGNVLIPALPQSLRRMVSVSIGGRFNDVSKPSNGGAASILITLPDDGLQMLPGTYALLPNSEHHQSLDPFQNNENWRNFGRCILRYAKSDIVNGRGSESYLNDFFSACELIEQSETHHELDNLTSNWSFAFLTYNAHLEAENARRRVGDFDPAIDLEQQNANFNESIWDSSDPSFLQELGFAEEEARRCYVGLELHTLKALLQNPALQIDADRYMVLARRAFTLKKQITDPVMHDELRGLYEQLLLRGIGTNENNAFEMLLLVNENSELSRMLADESEYFAFLMEKALEIYPTVPSDELLRSLAGYAQRGPKEQRLTTEYAVKLLSSSIEHNRIKVFRSVQTGAMLDEAVLSKLKADRFINTDYSVGLRNYADTYPAEGAISGNDLKAAYADALSDHITANPSFYRDSLMKVRKAFTDIGMEKSDKMMSALITCIEQPNRPFTDADVPYVEFVLSSDKEQAIDKLLHVLADVFEGALPRMFNQAVNNEDSSRVIDQHWLDCLSRSPENVRKRLHELLATRMTDYIQRERDGLRSHIPTVLRFFEDLGLNCSRDTLAMEALCACMESPGADFTQSDAAAVLPVLSSTLPSAMRMAKTVSKTFQEALPEIIEKRMPIKDQPWYSCIQERKQSEAQQQLAADLRDYLFDYAGEKPVELSSGLSYGVELLNAYNYKNEMRLVPLCCKLIDARLKRTDESGSQIDADLHVFSEQQSPLYKNVDAQEQSELADALNKLFMKELPRLVSHEPSREQWHECIKNKHVGEALKEKITAAIHQYVLANASGLYNDLDGVKKLYDAFGLSKEQLAESWCVLLSALQQNESGGSVLTDEYVNIFTQARLRIATAEDTQRVVQVYRLGLEQMLHGIDLERWAELNKSLAHNMVWQSNSQQAFVAFVENLTRQVKPELSEDHLTTLLTIIDAMGWNHTEAVRKAIADYFLALSRENLSHKELDGLMKLRSGNHELDGGLNKVFSHSLSRILQSGNMTAEEIDSWRAVTAEVDFKDAFRATVSQILKTAKIEGNDVGEAFTLALLNVGNQFDTLQLMAAEQVISIVEERKSVSDSSEHIAQELMTANEHQALQQTVLVCNRSQLINQYIDLLAYEPSDPENAANEKALRRKMCEMRESLFTAMKADSATYAIKRSSVWRTDLQCALLAKLEKATKAEGLTFEDLCDLPQRWAEECKDWQFVAFSDLTRYVNDNSLLEQAVEEGVKNVIDRSTFDELKLIIKRFTIDELNQNQSNGDENWYPKLIGRLVVEYGLSHLTQLTEGCRSPQDVKELRSILVQNDATVPHSAANALAMILAGGIEERISVTHQRLLRLDYEAQKITRILLRKAIFERSSEEWAKLWNADDCSGLVPYAAICYLGGKDADWVSFFEQLLQDASMDKKALQAGRDPVQALIFASSVLNDLGMHSEADDMVEQLKVMRREEYTHIKGLGRKRPELYALKTPEAWQGTGAAECLYKLIFNKH